MRVPDPLVSRRHAELTYADGGWVLRDLGSSNGTFRTVKAVQQVRIGAGAQVRLGGAGDDGLLVLLGTEAMPRPRPSVRRPRSRPRRPRRRWSRTSRAR